MQSITTESLVWRWMVGLALLVTASAAAGQPPQRPQRPTLGLASSPFPSEVTPGVKWFDSLAKRIRAATAAQKPICLIIAGQRPAGDC